MAVLYTQEDKRRALAELRIEPVNNRVDGDEAARILSWRAKQEQDVDHTYKVATVLKHADKLDARALNARKHDYDVDKVFALDIEPKRGRQAPTRKKRIQALEREKPSSNAA